MLPPSFLAAAWASLRGNGEDLGRRWRDRCRHSGAPLRRRRLRMSSLAQQLPTGLVDGADDAGDGSWARSGSMPHTASLTGDTLRRMPAWRRHACPAVRSAATGRPGAVAIAAAVGLQRPPRPARRCRPRRLPVPGATAASGSRRSRRHPSRRPERDAFSTEGRCGRPPARRSRGTPRAGGCGRRGPGRESTPGRAGRASFPAGPTRVADVIGEVELGVRSPLRRRQPPKRRHHPLAQPRHLRHRPRDMDCGSGRSRRGIDDQQRATAGVQPGVLVDVPHQRLDVTHPPFEALRSAQPLVTHQHLQAIARRPLSLSKTSAAGPRTDPRQPTSRRSTRGSSNQSRHLLSSSADNGRLASCHDLRYWLTLTSASCCMVANQNVILMLHLGAQ